MHASRGDQGSGEEKHTVALTGTASSASSVRLWYLIAVERASALSVEDEARIRNILVGGRRRCAELIARSPELVALVTEMVVEAKRDPRAREWFRHGRHESSLEMILQLVTEAESVFKQLPQGIATPVEHRALSEKIERLRLSLAGITELANRALDRRRVRAGLTDELVTQRDGLKQCRNELIDKHLDLVLSELRRMPRFGTDRRELLQEGNLGLIRAAELFDERGDVAFVPYALSWIRAFMRRLIETRRGALALPAEVNDKLAILRQHAIRIDQTTGQAATIAQLAAAAELDALEVRRLMLVRALAFEVVQNEVPSPSQAPERDFRDSGGVSALDALIELELIRTVSAALASLNEREASVISERYGFRQSAVTSRPVIARKLGVSAERVRQIENGALAKIAKALADVGVSAEEVGSLVLGSGLA